MINGVETVKHLVKTQEHAVYTVEPPGDYLCHSEIQHGTGYDLAEDTRDVLVEYDSERSIVAVASDGTAVMTGWKDGMLAHLERLLQIILLWLVCQVRLDINLKMTKLFFFSYFLYAQTDENQSVNLKYIL